jgi:hypothetical protein
VLGSLIFGEVFVDSDQPKDLSSWGLKVEVRIGHFKYLDAEGNNFLPHVFDVVGLQLQVNRFQKLVFIQGDFLALVEKREVEVLSHTEVVLLIALSHDLATEDITIELTNSILFCPRNSNRRMVPKNYLCHGHSLELGRSFLVLPV